MYQIVVGPCKQKTTISSSAWRMTCFGMNGWMDGWGGRALPISIFNVEAIGKQQSQETVEAAMYITFVI